jgi:membrane-bound inhibitor of C-type lysozyme
MRRLIPLVALFALAACQTGSEETAAAAADTTAAPADVAAAGDSAAVGDTLAFPHGPHRYVCANGRAFDALFPVPDSVRVTLAEGQTLALPSVLSADGARYSDGLTTAWFKGMDEGFVQERDSITYPDCHTAE